jgi:hypothetical protein
MTKLEMAKQLSNEEWTLANDVIYMEICKQLSQEEFQELLDYNKEKCND